MYITDTKEMANELAADMRALLSTWPSPWKAGQRFKR